jgi:hypothetical protein
MFDQLFWLTQLAQAADAAAGHSSLSTILAYVGIPAWLPLKVARD